MTGTEIAIIIGAVLGAGGLGSIAIPILGRNKTKADAASVLTDSVMDVLEAYKEDNKEIRAEFKVIKQEMEDMRNANIDLEKTKEQLRSENEEFRKLVEELKSTIQDLQKQVNSLKRENTSLRKSIKEQKANAEKEEK